MADSMSPRCVAEALSDTDHWRRRDAQQIVKAYSKRWNRSVKRSPPTFYVLLPPNNGGIEAVCVGWAFAHEQFVHEIVSEGLGVSRRAEARAGAWDLYEETWRDAHAALIEVGAIELADKLGRPAVPRIKADPANPF